MQRRNNSDYNYVFAVCMFNYNMSIFIDSLSLTLIDFEIDKLTLKIDFFNIVHKN